MIGDGAQKWRWPGNVLLQFLNHDREYDEYDVDDVDDRDAPQARDLVVRVLC